MFATIYLPNFYLQAATRHQPELCEKPVALIEEHERKPLIIQLNEAAENAGIRKGMTPSQASGAIIAGGHQSSCTHAGKIDTGNLASPRVYSQSFCRRHCAGRLHNSIYELPQFE